MTDRDLRALFNRIVESSTANRSDIETFRQLFHKVQEDAVVYQGFWEDLRDRFAMSLITGLLACDSHDFNALAGEEAKRAAAAYRIADAMMKARKVRPLNDEIVNNKFVEYRPKGE